MDPLRRGFIRRELAAFSDIDLTFVPQRDGDPVTDRIIREMFTLVMDVLIAKSDGSNQVHYFVEAKSSTEMLLVLPSP